MHPHINSLDDPINILQQAKLIGTVSKSNLLFKQHIYITLGS